MQKGICLAPPNLRNLCSVKLRPLIYSNGFFRKEATKSKLQRSLTIFSVCTDINSSGRTGNANRGSIEVYWAVIGLVAALLDVRIEDLTTVVLTHELAHAYTHLGYDIDGANWPGQCFAKTESVLKEGLAHRSHVKPSVLGYVRCQAVSLSSRPC